MKDSLIFLLLFIFLSPSKAQFEGIIKYESLNSRTMKPDTIIYFFGDKMIKIERYGELARNYGAISSMYYKFDEYPNTAFLWSDKMNMLTKVEIFDDHILTLKENKDTSMIYLLKTCQLIEIEFDPSENRGKTYESKESIWYSNTLNYDIGDHSTFYEHVFSNGTNCISLYIVKSVIDNSPSAENLNPTIMKAFELIPQKLDDSIFDIPTIDN